MDQRTSDIEQAVNAAIIDIARDSQLDETEALSTLSTCAKDMSAIERSQMLEALNGVRFKTMKDLADQISLINEGQKRETEGKLRPTSE